ncbi:MAG: SAGA HAT/Core module component [Bathelium mastoideum]|nr:MAG: SAGA HAT/Core module component [Bathelium mastoideum]
MSEARNDIPSAALDNELESLYRNTLKHTEEALHILETKNDPSLSITAAFKVLAALREASESEPHHGASSSAPMSRSSSTAKPVRDRKRKLDATSSTISSSNTAVSGSAIVDDNEGISPAPITVGTSPKVAAGVSKLVSTHKDKRSGSVPSSTRDGSVSVKIEDFGDSSSLDGSSIKEPMSSTSTTTSGPANPLVTPSANRSSLKLQVGSEVFWRNKARNAEGSGILCTITAVIGEGKQRRYEIQDADPEIDPATGQPPPPARPSVQNLIPIPPSTAGLDEDGGLWKAMSALEKGKQVLALYPGTTTFYKAEVSREWKAGGIDGGGTVRLRFEGEDEIEKEMDVERRYVLNEGLK